jgi:anti-sigma B factor antagonist
MAELESDSPAEAVIQTGADANGVPVITVSGELDMSNADTLASAVSSAATRNPELLVFDLSGLRFMDSAGIAVLIGASSQVKAVRLRSPSLAVRRVVELSGLAQVLPIES